MEIEYRRCKLCPEKFALGSPKSKRELCGGCLKILGMEAAAENPARTGMLDLVRRAAHYAGRFGGDTTIEDAHRNVIRFYELTLDQIESVLSYAAGSVFRDGCWTPTGRRIKATLRPENHARELQVWRLKPEWRERCE